jgi:hypothetical protein
MPVHMTERVHELKGPSGSAAEERFVNALMGVLRGAKPPLDKAMLLYWPITGGQELLVMINSPKKEVEVCFPDEANPELLATLEAPLPKPEEVRATIAKIKERSAGRTATATGTIVDMLATDD